MTTDQTQSTILDDAELDAAAAGRGTWGLVIKEWETTSASKAVPVEEVSFGYTEVEWTY